ncbi:MAG: thiamine-phosphate kinase [Dissulfurispiraceae bacterium]|jgi:thiamine-monophosphate kinase|nr:thiamine-phosphate kinase [Dissulfurispiraceae bacterium]
MRIKEAGELNLLQEIKRRHNPSSTELRCNPEAIVGIGDDAAVLSLRDRNTLITTDMMIEGVHFDLSFTNIISLGYKLVSVNVSDIMAMAASPRYLFLNMAINGETEVDDFWRLFSGIEHAIGIYDLQLLGGDLSSSPGPAMLSATLLGASDSFVTRAGACPGDRIYVTGTLGNSACGLELLKRLSPDSKEMVRKIDFIYEFNFEGVQTLRLDDSENSLINFSTALPLIKRHLAPDARASQAYAAAATSMMDISDGLFIDLNRLCDESGVGAEIDLAKIPVSAELVITSGLLGLDMLNLAVSGGEDYELLFTAPPKISESELQGAVCIGVVTDSGRFATDSDGRRTEIKPRGYQHFENP